MDQHCIDRSIDVQCMFVMFWSSLILVILIVREHKVVLEDLDKAQVDILHVGSNRKNAADDKLKQLMRRYRLQMRKKETLKEIEILGYLKSFCNKNDFTGLLTCIEMAPALFSSGAISPYLSPLWHRVFLEMPLHICLLCNIVYFLKCLFIFVSQRRHGFCRRHCRLQEKNVSLRHSAPQVHR